MCSLKTFFLVSFIFILLSFPISIKAQQGCCSWHGGVAGCSNGRTLCADGTLSPSCVCSTSYGDESEEAEEEVTGWQKFIAFVVIVGGWFGFGFVLMAIDDYKKKKAEKERERENAEINRLHLEQLERDLKNIKTLKSKFFNGENMTTLLEYLNGEITSDDIIDIIRVDKKDEVKILLDELYKRISLKSYYIKESDIFYNVCLKIINGGLLTSKENIVEYIFDSYDYNYGQIFLDIIKSGNYVLAKNILKNTSNCQFSLDEKEVGEIYNKICSVKESELAELISKRNIFSYSYYDSSFSIFKSLLEENDIENLKIYCKLFQHSVYQAYPYMPDTIDMISKTTDVTLLECYLNECNDIEKFMNENGFKLIFLSVKRLNYKSIEYVLTNYKNINLNMLQEGMSPLMYACYRRNYRIVKALVEYGVDINYVDEHGDNALLYACAGRSLKICKLLIERGGVVDPYYMERIEYAIKHNESYLLPYVTITSILFKKNKRKHK